MGMGQHGCLLSSGAVLFCFVFWCTHKLSSTRPFVEALMGSQLSVGMWTLAASLLPRCLVTEAGGAGFDGSLHPWTE